MSRDDVGAGHAQEVPATTAWHLTSKVRRGPALTRALDTLADRRVLRLDDAAWTEFAAILDRPAKRIPELVKLLNEPAPWDT